MTPACISRIVSLIRKKPEVIREEIDKGAEKADVNESLAIFIEDKLRSGEIIQRAADICTDFETRTGITVKVHRVR